MKPTTKKWKTEKLIVKKTGMLRSIGKQSEESGESVLKKKEGYGEKDLQKRKVLSPERKSEGWWDTNNNNYKC